MDGAGQLEYPSHVILPKVVWKATTGLKTANISCLLGARYCAGRSSVLFLDLFL